MLFLGHKAQAKSRPIRMTQHWSKTGSLSRRLPHWYCLSCLRLWSLRCAVSSTDWLLTALAGGLQAPWSSSWNPNISALLKHSSIWQLHGISASTSKILLLMDGTRIPFPHCLCCTVGSQANLLSEGVALSPREYALPYGRQKRPDGTLPSSCANVHSLRTRETPRTINTFKDITALSRCSISTRDYARSGSHLTHGETT